MKLPSSPISPAAAATQPNKAQSGTFRGQKAGWTFYSHAAEAAGGHFGHLDGWGSRDKNMRQKNVLYKSLN